MLQITANQTAGMPCRFCQVSSFCFIGDVCCSTASQPRQYFWAFSSAVCFCSLLVWSWALFWHGLHGVLPSAILGMRWELTGTGTAPSRQEASHLLVCRANKIKQSGPELFWPFGLGDGGQSLLYWIYWFLSCCVNVIFNGNSQKIPDSFYSFCWGKCQGDSIYIRLLHVLYDIPDEYNKS